MASTWLLALHLIGAAGWVGGQLTLGPVTAALRRRGTEREDLRAMARAAGYVLWGSLALAVVTGFAMLGTLGALNIRESPYGALLEWKIFVVVLAAIAAAAHTFARRIGKTEKAQRALLGAGAGIALLASLAILFLAAYLPAVFPRGA